MRVAQTHRLRKKMPTYNARCNNCETVYEYVCPVAERYDTPECECGGIVQVVILKAPQGFVKGNFDRFRSPVDGSIIGTERDLRNHNARNNVVNIHDGYDEATVLRGEYVKPPKKDKRDVAQDVYDAYQHVDTTGYKPHTEVIDDA
jgi:predicted nucleic acid-binding Zn ribbon protein